jgi:GNAT superfamily N-acetyltransferase
MRDTIVIRNGVKPGDLGSIVKLHGEYYARNYGFDATFEPYVAIPLAECVQRNRDDERIWIVEENNQFKGSIAITRFKDDTAQLRWYILDESVQGQGVGKRLMDAAMEFVRGCGYKRIILWTVSELDKAIGIYLRYGFRLGEEKPHRIWGRDLVEQEYCQDL